MNNITVTLTLILLFISSLAFGQAPDTTIHLSRMEYQKVAAIENMKREVQKIWQDYYKFLGEFIIANKIDQAPGSPDSVIFVAPDSLKFILRNKPVKK